MDKACAAGNWRTPTAFTSLDPREVKSAMIKESEEEILIETGRMAARLIHDFKNQLGGLKLYAAYLQKRFADNAEGMEITQKIAQGLNEMAEQAVLLQRLCRPIELQMAPGNPAPVVESAVSTLGPRASAKRVKISCDLEPGAPRVSFDPRQIGEALEAMRDALVRPRRRGPSIRHRMKASVP